MDSEGPDGCGSLGWAFSCKPKGCLPVQFPVRAHALVAGQVPDWRCAKDNQ